MESGSIVMKTDRIFLFLSIMMLLLEATAQENRLSFSDIKRARIYYERADSLMKNAYYEKAAFNYSKTFNIIRTNKHAGFEAAKAYCLAGKNDSALKYVRMTIQAGGLFDYENEAAFRSIRWSDEFLELMEVYELMKSQLENRYIEPLVYLPENYKEDKSYPLLVALHGFSDNPEKFAKVFSNAALKNECILMSCRGSEVIGQGAYAWNQSQQEYERLYNDIQTAMRKYRVDKTKVILSGYWQGGLLVYGLGVSFSELFKGLLLIDSNVPNDLLINKMENKKLKVYAMLGTDDNEEMIEQNEQVGQLFTANGVAFKLVKFEGRSHAFPSHKEEVLGIALKWLLE